ncbi:hypothetical protein BAUCODRAFT_80053 [Baudoinia panamericana UAMH 10762]|uniref:Eukaryotic translation initiation factor 3 subunit M n=1 Tax=Baudoinia panamericana (strain UAMH 10762) TaxID=717646 RepID=M2LC55_BAUPA|nr:uncharacterized protein BAUCODRAFT_80053 [Baudoinia panamericana UAMH 10762]EMC91502.1 hypothetical protein BAUCODRAFT_80053 [Baudoinia panamericana UAMH 10762]
MVGRRRRRRRRRRRWHQLLPPALRPVVLPLLPPPPLPRVKSQPSTWALVHPPATARTSQASPATPPLQPKDPHPPSNATQAAPVTSKTTTTLIAGMPGLPRLSLVEGAFEELAQELATYIDSIRGEGSNLASDILPNLGDAEKPAEERAADTDKEAVLKKLVAASSALNSAPERELQAAYNLLIHLIHQAPKPQIFLPRVCHFLTSPISSASSPQTGNGIALGILGTLFNTIQPEDVSRYHVLLAIVTVVGRSGTYINLRPQLADVDEWVKQWEATSEDFDSEDAQKLYLEISKAAAASNSPDAAEESYLYLLKALRTAQDEPSSSEARELSIRALKTALENEKHFDFQDLTSLDSVQALRKSDETWSDLLELFVDQSFDDFMDFKESNPSFLSEQKLSEDVLDRKMRLLTLCTLAAQASETRTLPYATISRQLQIPAEETESWVIDCIRSGLVEGKLSQQRQEFLIHRATQRVFGEKQWREVASRLETWRSSLVNVLAVIRQQKQEYITEKEAEMAGPEVRSGQGYRPDRRQRNQGGMMALEVE